MAFEGKIEEIWAQHDSEHLTIWKPGFAAPVAVEVPEGASWELHVKTTAAWPEVSPFATAVTLGGGDGVGANAKMWAGAYEFAFNMPRMTAEDFAVGRARFWKNRANTNVPPPEADR